MRVFTILLLFVVAIFVSCDKDIDDVDGVVEGQAGSNQNYYFNSTSGSDGNDGLTAVSPFKSLYMLKNISLKSGDTVFLAKDAVFQGDIKLLSLSGTKEIPIVITSFGEGAQLPTINAAGSLAGIYIKNSSHIKISNLRIVADGAGQRVDTDATSAKMRCGVLYEVTENGEYSNILLEGLHVENVYMNEDGYTRDPDEVSSANGTGTYGWGIRFVNELENIVSDITVKSCKVNDVSHSGIRFFGKKGNFTNITIHDCIVMKTGGPGMQMGGVNIGHVYNNTVDGSGSTDDSRKWGRGSGYWCFGSDNLIVEHNYFANANGPNDSAGAHIDYNCTNVIFQYNFSINNAGGFCEILGNNENCSYRYNISVNDGQRKVGDQGAKKSGLTLFISGYVGGNNNVGPFNTYVYNNTIFVKDGYRSYNSITSTANGLLIANNIFHVLGVSQADTDAPFHKVPKNCLFENNLFLTDASWSDKNPLKISDANATYGDAGFVMPNGVEIVDYTPQNTDLIKNKGILIEKLVGDEIGLYLGLEVEKDILGNPIVGKPGLGAIHL